MSGPRIAVLLLLALGAACYQAPSLSGPYRCDDSRSCGDGLVCDDGVCCNPTGEPFCRSYVLDGGTCLDGGAPAPYFEDLDGDGYGNENQTRWYCADPIEDPFIPLDGDCNDNPAAGGALVHPEALEQCDLVDNDCDGEIDEGLPGTPHHPDLDGDGYGDESAAPVTLCATQPGTAPNALDCNDDPQEGGAIQHPGATEACNGRDDDCDGTIDEGVTAKGLECTVPGGQGVCALGTIVCEESGPVCHSVLSPSAEICDSKDNDCDGEVDEKPDCGGPLSFKNDPEVALGAKALSGSPLNGSSTSCVKGNPGSSESFNGATWSGSGAGSHVAWAERKSGFWDLSRGTQRMKLKLSWSVTNGNSTLAWADHFQPVVLICGPNGFIRLVHTASKLMPGATGTFDEMVPLRGGELGWQKGTGSSPDHEAVLRQVERIELLVQPNYNGGTVPSFRIDVGAWGLP